jgi:hypothetical protein
VRNAIILVAGALLALIGAYPGLVKRSLVKRGLVKIRRA